MDAAARWIAAETSFDDKTIPCNGGVIASYTGGRVSARGERGLWNFSSVRPLGHYCLLQRCVVENIDGPCQE